MPNRALMHRNLALALLAGGCLAAPAAGQVALSTVAVTGQSSGAGSTRLAGFDSPVVSPEGQVGFVARLSGKGVNPGNDQAVIVRNARGRLAAAARSGSAAPGVRNARMFGFDSLVMGQDANLAFSTRLVGTGFSGEAAVMQGRVGGLRTVARAGENAAGAVIDDLGSLVMGHGGHVAMIAGLEGGSRALLWAAPGTGPQAFRQGQPQGGLGGRSLDTIGEPSVNPAGQAAFQGFLADANPQSASDAGVFMLTGGVLGVGAGEGMTLSNAPGAAVSTFTMPGLNGAGTLAFTSMLTGGGVNWGNDFAVVSEGRAAVRMGDALPGGLSVGLLGAPLLDADGNAAFMGSVMGPGVNAGNDMALWLTTAQGDRFMIAREGEEFGSARAMTVLQLRECAAARGGRVVFIARVQDGQQAREALLAWDPSRGPVTVLATGDEVAQARGPAKRVMTFGFVAGSGGEDGRATGLSSEGVVAVKVVYDDKSEAILLGTLPKAAADVATVSGQMLSDGRITREDLTTFMAAFASGDLAADISGRVDGLPGGDGVVDQRDLDAFTASYEAAR